MVKGQGHWNFTSFHWSTGQKWWLFLVEVVWTTMFLHTPRIWTFHSAQAYPLHCITKNWLKWLNFVISRTTHVCAAAPSVVSVFGCGVGWIIDQLAASRLLCYHRDGGWEPLSADVRRCCCWNMMGTGSERHWHRNGTEKRKTPPGWGECQAPRRRKLNPGFSSGKGWTAASELDLRHQEGTFAVICGCWGEG